MSKLIKGYVRAEVPLNVLDTSVNKSSTSPLAGVLEISTEDGVLISDKRRRGQRPENRFRSISSRGNERRTKALKRGRR